MSKEDSLLRLLEASSPASLLWLLVLSAWSTNNIVTKNKLKPYRRWVRARVSKKLEFC
jgi:hypothetical protein